MAALKTAIEFIPQEDWEKTSFGKILRWVLTVGRWIVITTELVVILAFLSRFKLDKDLTELNEKIKEQQAIINASSGFEKEFSFLQKRLSNIEDLRKTQTEGAQVLNQLAELTPVDVRLESISVADKKISLTATALSEGGLATLLQNLKTSPGFTKVIVSKISLETAKEAGINFNLTSEFKESRGL